MGNLSIEPKSANSSRGNQDVEIKLNKYFVKAPYNGQNELSDFLEPDGKSQKWTINSINNRKEKLLKFAEKTWCNFKQFGIINKNLEISVEDGDEN